ncbi:MAG: hydrolase [Bacillota bacterium]
MEKILQQILEKLTELSHGQEALRSDVGALQKGQQTLEQGQQELRSSVNNLQEAQIRLEKGQKRLEKGQKDIIKQLDAVWKDIKKLDDRLELQEKRSLKS